MGLAMVFQQTGDMEPLGKAAVRAGVNLYDRQLRCILRAHGGKLPAVGSGSKGGIRRMDVIKALIELFFADQSASEKLRMYKAMLGSAKSNESAIDWKLMQAVSQLDHSEREHFKPLVEHCCDKMEQKALEKELKKRPKEKEPDDCEDEEVAEPPPSEAPPPMPPPENAEPPPSEVPPPMPPPENAEPPPSEAPPPMPPPENAEPPPSEAPPPMPPPENPPSPEERPRPAGPAYPADADLPARARHNPGPRAEAPAAPAAPEAPARRAVPRSIRDLFPSTSRIQIRYRPDKRNIGVEFRGASPL